MNPGQRPVDEYVQLILEACIRCTKREDSYDADLPSRLSLKAPNQPEWYQSEQYLNDNIECRD